MGNEDFYIILPSNVQSIDGTINKTSHFKSQLPRPLELIKEDWEISIVQIN